MTQTDYTTNRRKNKRFYNKIKKIYRDTFLAKNK